MAGALVLLCLLSWWFLLSGAGMPGKASMSGMSAMAPPPLLALITMWWLMMVAMMVPSAAPAILLYDRVRAQRGTGSVARTSLFVLGYVAAWLAFAVLAALAQQRVAGRDMALSDGRIASSVLIAAGFYQLSPLKNACLRQCRTPAEFLSRNWRAGTMGAVRLGVLHGTFCVGCCWLLMALLFVGGVMNFAWIAVLTIAVGAEKLLPGGEWTARIAGLVLILWGSWRLLG